MSIFLEWLKRTIIVVVVGTIVTFGAMMVRNDFTYTDIWYNQLGTFVGLVALTGVAELVVTIITLKKIFEVLGRLKRIHKEKKEKKWRDYMYKYGAEDVCHINFVELIMATLDAIRYAFIGAVPFVAILAAVGLRPIKENLLEMGAVFILFFAIFFIIAQGFLVAFSHAAPFLVRVIRSISTVAIRLHPGYFVDESGSTYMGKDAIGVFNVFSLILGIIPFAAVVVVGIVALPYTIINVILMKLASMVKNSRGNLAQGLFVKVVICLLSFFVAYLLVPIIAIVSALSL